MTCPQCGQENPQGARFCFNCGSALQGAGAREERKVVSVLFAEEHANVVSIEHHREGMDTPVTESEVEATLLTRDQEHCTAIIYAMRLRGYAVDRLH